MNVHLFNKIVQVLKKEFPKASYDFLMEQARQMYEEEMRRRDKLSLYDGKNAENRDLFDL